MGQLDLTDFYFKLYLFRFYHYCIINCAKQYNNVCKTNVLIMSFDEKYTTEHEMHNNESNAKWASNNYDK